MKGQGGEALDVALGLLRAPALRAALRARPLPCGMSEVLSIASGSSEGVRVAAVRTGYPEAELVEAARFFVQQVLLADGEDAYRVLGAERHAPQGTLRDHHRMLQRWLHPDRSPGADWDSALSTRVNQAWNQLRTESVRSAYDASFPSPPRFSDESMSAGAGGIPYPYPLQPGVHAPAPQRLSLAPVAVGVLGLACVALAWLAMNQDDFINHERELPDSVAQQAAPSRIPEPALVTTPMALGQRASSESRAGTVRESPTEEVASTVDAEPLVLAARAPEWPVERDSGVRAFHLSTPLVAAPPEPAASPSAVDDPAPAAIATSGNQRTAAAVSAPSEVEVLRRTGVPPAVHPSREAGPSSQRSLDAGSPAVMAVVHGEVHTPAVQAQASAGVSPAVPALPPVNQAREAEDPFQLFLEAEKTVRDVTQYLAGTGAEPSWADLSVGVGAAHLRSGLQLRHDGAQRKRMEIDGPDWNLGEGRALMSAPYRLAAGRRTVETGMLRVNLTRRGGQWQIRSLDLKPLP